MTNYLYVHINNDYSGSTYAMKAIIKSSWIKIILFGYRF